MTEQEIRSFIDEAIDTKEGSRLTTAQTTYFVKHYSSLHEVNCWAENGMISIFNHETNLPLDYLKELLYQAISEYEDGYARCAGCGGLVKITDIAGSIFAGVYCKDCWDSEYKEIAANTCYD